ncbi:hypothetical protein J9332_35935, partial [Aquimarina celericrescens]|nr:hypothetical protein [Aquimarina celericrescens]
HRRSRVKVSSFYYLYFPNSLSWVIIQDRCKQFKNEIMKIRILQLVILVGIFINTNVIAQQCGTPTTGSNQDFFLSKNGITGDDSICINVSFHIVRQSNGSGGFNSSNIDLTIK